MNDYLSALFNTPQDIDPQLAAASEILAKVAEDEGVDLDQYSDEEIAGMLGQIMDDGGEGSEGAEEETGQGAEGSEAAGGDFDEKVSHLTVADVAGELAKQAAAEGIDLSQLSREQLHNAYNYVHTLMTDPEVQQQKVAMEEKVAEADMLGRVMAHSFDDELSKIALKVPGREAAAKAYGAVKGKAMEAGEKITRAVGKRVAKGEKSLMGVASAPSDAAIMEAGRKALRTAGKATGAAAALGTAAGAGYAAGRKKKAFDEAVIARAREIAEARGYNPDTGEKVASDVDIEAINLLRANGYDI